MFAGEDGPYRATGGATLWAISRQVWDPRFQNADTRHLELHNEMVCPSVVIVLYWIWYDL